MSSTEKTPPCPPTGQEDGSDNHDQHHLDDVDTRVLQRELRRRRKVERAQRRDAQREAQAADPLVLPADGRDPFTGDCPPWCTYEHPVEISARESVHWGNRVCLPLPKHMGWRDEEGAVHLAYVSVRLHQFATQSAPHVLLGKWEQDPDVPEAGSFVAGSRYALDTADALALAALLVEMVDVAAGVAAGDAS